MRRKYQDTLKALFSSKLVLIVFIVILAFVMKAAWGVYQKFDESRGNAQVAEVELDEVEKRKRNLSASINALQTERGVEAQIRDKFNVVKEGEEVIVILDEEKKTHKSKQEKGFWSGVWDTINIFN